MIQGRRITLNASSTPSSFSLEERSGRNCHLGTHFTLRYQYGCSSLPSCLGLVSGQGCIYGVVVLRVRLPVTWHQLRGGTSYKREPCLTSHRKGRDLRGYKGGEGIRAGALHTSHMKRPGYSVRQELQPKRLEEILGSRTQVLERTVEPSKRLK